MRFDGKGIVKFWRRGSGKGEGGSGMLEIAIINFTFLLHDSHLTYYLQSD